MREICTSGSTRGRWATDLFCYPPSYSTDSYSAGAKGKIKKARRKAPEHPVAA